MSLIARSLSVGFGTSAGFGGSETCGIAVGGGGAEIGPVAGGVSTLAGFGLGCPLANGSGKTAFGCALGVPYFSLESVMIFSRRFAASASLALSGKGTER